MPRTARQIATIMMAKGPIVPIAKGGTYNHEFTDGAVPYKSHTEEKLVDSPISVDEDGNVTFNGMPPGRIAADGETSTTNTSPEALMTVTLPAGTFGADGDSIRLVAQLHGTRNVLNPTDGYGFELLFGSDSLISDSSTLEGKRWEIDLSVLRSSLTEMVTVGGSVSSGFVPDDLTEDIDLVLNGYAIGTSGTMRLKAFYLEKK